MANWTAPRTWTDGEFVTAAIMNAHVRDNLLNVGEHVHVPKSSDQNKASDITPAADSALLLPVGTNQTWQWRARVYATAGAGGFRLRWDVPASASGYFTSTSAAASAGIFEQYNLAYGADAAAGLTAGTGLFFGVVITGGTSGNLAFAWAQQTSNAANTTVKAGSYIMARRIA